MSYEFYPSRIKIFLGICLWVTLAGSGLILLIHARQDSIFFIACALVGGCSYAVLIKLRLLFSTQPLVTIDEFGIFDRQTMKVPIPWEAVERPDLFIKTYNWPVLGMHAWPVAGIIVKPNLHCNWRRRWFVPPGVFLDISHVLDRQNPNKFVTIDTRYICEEPDAVFIAMLDWAQIRIWGTYFEYLHNQRSPRKTRARFEQALNAIDWEDGDVSELIGILYWILRGPVADETMHAIREKIACLIKRDERSVREHVVENLPSIVDGYRAIAIFLNSELENLGLRGEASRIDTAELDFEAFGLKNYPGNDWFMKFVGWPCALLLTFLPALGGMIFAPGSVFRYWSCMGLDCSKATEIGTLGFIAVWYGCTAFVRTYRVRNIRI